MSIVGPILIWANICIQNLKNYLNVAMLVRQQVERSVSCKAFYNNPKVRIHQLIEDRVQALGGSSYPQDHCVYPPNQTPDTMATQLSAIYRREGNKRERERERDENMNT